MVEFQSTISERIKDLILSELEAIERKNSVRILFAIESGSRAWGFPSPDSDYDVRFVYAHDVDWYFSLSSGRDVIELPIEDDLDINGWDIRKALNLMLKPNPVLLEWLSSPIRYLWNDTACAALREFSESVSHSTACLNHYHRLATRQWGQHISDNEQVNLKKYFYVARPAMNLRWLRLHPDVIPPMNFQDLMAGLDLSSELKAKFEALIRQKSVAKEIGLAPRIDEIDAFIQSEMLWAEDAIKNIKPVKNDLQDKADDLFRAIVRNQIA